MPRAKPESLNVSFRISDPKVLNEFLRQLHESGQESPSLFARQLLTQCILSRSTRSPDADSKQPAK